MIPQVGEQNALEKFDVRKLTRQVFLSGVDAVKGTDDGAHIPLQIARFGSAVFGPCSPWRLGIFFVPNVGSVRLGLLEAVLVTTSRLSRATMTQPNCCEPDAQTLVNASIACAVSDYSQVLYSADCY